MSDVLDAIDARVRALDARLETLETKLRMPSTAEQRLAKLINQVRAAGVAAKQAAQFDDNETRALFEIAAALMDAAIEAES